MVVIIIAQICITDDSTFTGKVHQQIVAGHGCWDYYSTNLCHGLNGKVLGLRCHTCSCISRSSDYLGESISKMKIFMLHLSLLFSKSRIVPSCTSVLPSWWLTGDRIRAWIGFITGWVVHRWFVLLLKLEASAQPSPAEPQTRPRKSPGEWLESR